MYKKQAISFKIFKGANGYGGENGGRKKSRIKFPTPKKFGGLVGTVNQQTNVEGTALGLVSTIADFVA